MYSARNNQAEELIRIFEDTRDWYEQDPELRKIVDASVAGTVLYPMGTAPALGQVRYSEPLSVSVSRRRTLEAALDCLRENPGEKVTIHNFASGTNPGGGVTRGSSAQEESICRCSTLYPVLNTPYLRRKFYSFHRGRRDLRYTDTCIFTPGVAVIKTDTSRPERMDREDWRQVDVITCAAPNLREQPHNAMNPGQGPALRLSNAELLEIHRERARKILQTAAAHGTDTLILGAFGCGAFRNPPEIVARAYREVLNQFNGYLRRVEFAVYCSSKNSQNYDASRATIR